MKRIRLLSVLLLFALLFSACGENTSAVIYCTWDEIIQSGISFRIEGLYGKSEEALSARERAYGYFSEGLHAYLDTETHLFFRERLGVPFVYDKATGTVTLACQIDSCSHTNCIWARAGSSVYSGGNALLFYVHEENTLYAGDMHGENLRVLYENKGENLFGFEPVDGYVYFEELVGSETTQDETRMVYRILRAPVDGSGEAEQVGKEYRDGVYFLPTKNVYLYSLPGSATCFLYDRRANSTTALPRNAESFILYGDWLYYINVIGEWTPDDPYSLCRISLYDTSVQETMFDYNEDARILFGGETMYLLERTVHSKSYAFGSYYAYRLYAVDLQSFEKTLRMTFETDEIPDKIDEIWIDGNLLYVQYRTYLDFPNEYCPSDVTGESHTMLIDLSNDRRILFRKGGTS